MDYAIACECGQTIHVSAGEAGGTKHCACGKEVSIPRLSVLRKKVSQEPKLRSDRRGAGASERRQTGNTVVIAACCAAIVMAATLVPPPYVALVGSCMVLLGRIWFALLIFSEMTLANALVVFFVPLMPTIFFIKRIDVTWKPFVFGLIGYFLFASSLALVKS